MINLGISPLSSTTRKICADKWNLTLDLWVREAIGEGVITDEWEIATTHLRQIVVSLMTIATSRLSREVRNLEFYMKYPHF